MVTVKVQFFARLKEITGKTEVVIESLEEETVRELLAELSKHYGKAFDKYIYAEEGQIADHIQILLNKTSITNLQGLETKLKDGVQMDIVPLVAGG